jgi:hypothetical protein
MALKTADIAKIINEYRANIKNKALPPSIKLDQVNQQVDYLSDLVKNSSGNEVALTSPADVQKVMGAVNTLSAISKQDDVKTLNEKISLGKERYQRTVRQLGRDLKNGNALSSVDPLVGYSGMRTLASIKEMQAEWQRKKARVYLPPEWRTAAKASPEISQLYSYDAATQEKIRFYQQMASALPPDQKNRVQQLIYSLNDPNERIEILKQQHTQTLNNAINRIQAENADKKDLVDNTVIDTAAFTDQEKEAFQFVETMSEMPERNEAFVREADTLQQLQSIYSAFNAPSQADVEAAQAAQNKQSQLAGVLEKAKKGQSYDQLTDAEKEYIKSKSSEYGMDPKYYYETVVQELPAYENEPDKRAKQYAAQTKKAEEADPSKLNSEKFNAQTEKEKEAASQTTANGPSSTSKRSPVDTTTSNARASTPVIIEEPLPNSPVTTTSTTPVQNYTNATTSTLNSGTLAGTTLVGASAAGASTIGSSATVAGAAIATATITASTINTPKVEVNVQNNQLPNNEKALRDEFKFEDEENNLRDDFKFEDNEPEHQDSITERIARNEAAIETDNRLTALQSPQLSIKERMRQASQKQRTNVPNDNSPLLSRIANQEARQDYENARLDTSLRVSMGVSEPETYSGLSTLSTPKIYHDSDEIDERFGRAVQGLKALTPQQRAMNALSAKRQQIFFSSLAEGNVVEAFSLPSLLGPTYKLMAANWVKNKTLGLAADIQDSIFSSSQWHQIKGVWNKNKRYWRTKNRFGNVVHKVGLFKTRLRRKKKSLLGWIVEEAFNVAVKGVIGGGIKLAQMATQVGSRINQLSGMKGALGNLTTAAYEKVQKIAGLDATATSNKALQGVSEAVNDVRQGFSKLSLFAGETGVVLQGAGKILGAVGGALPGAILSAAALSLGAGSIPIGVAVGTMVLGGGTLNNLLSQDHTALINSIDDVSAGWGKHEWGGLGNWMHARANGVRGFFQGIQKAGSADIKIKDGQFTPEAADKIRERGGKFSGMQIGVEAATNGLTTFAVLDPILVAMFGPMGHLYAIGAGMLAGGGTVAGRLIQNKVYAWALQKGGAIQKFFAMPLMDTFNVAGDVSRLSQELTLLRVKYHWDLGKYFQSEWSNNNNIFDKAMRGLNFAGGIGGVLNIPRVIAAWGNAFGLPSMTVGEVFLPAIVSTLLSLGILSMLGLTGPGALIGMTIGVGLGVTAGVAISGLVDVGTGGIGAVTNFAIVTFFGTLGGTLGGLVGGWVDWMFGKAISYGQLLIGGIQAIWELFMMWKRGLDFSNLLQFILAISGLIATLNYMQTMSGTNNCTIYDECFWKKDSTTGGSQMNNDYLAYYNVNVVTSNSADRQADISKVLQLLDRDPDALKSDYTNNKSIYVYVADTDDIYVNNDMVILAISHNTLATPNTSLKRILEVYASVN